MASTTTARSYETTGDELLCREGRIIAGLLAGWRCPCCGARMAIGHGPRAQWLTIDHVEAHANGGGVIGNLVPLCMSCNSSKRDAADLQSWAETRLVSIGDYASRNAWCRRAAARKAADILALRDALTAALTEAGIW